MEQMVSAKEFRLHFTEMCEKILKGTSLLVLKRSKPIFRAEPLINSHADLLDRVKGTPGKALSLEEINEVVHRVRREIA